VSRGSRLAAVALCAALSAACAGPRARRAVKRPVPPLAKAVLRTARSYLPEEEKNRAAPKDCSDFVGKVFLENGVKLPRTALEMSKLGDPIASSRDIQMGDLVFFSGEKIGRTVGHVGIYVGNGIFIHRSLSAEGVRMDSLYNDYFRKRYLKARRIIP